MKLKEALDIKPGEVISLVGGGGKTTLMFALAQELASRGESVITTTTTKIREPSPSETPFLLLETDEDKMIKALQNLDRYRHITIAGERSAPGKLKGVSPELIVKLSQLSQISCIIVEADGAAQKSLKAPNLTEPVIPSNTSFVIAVVGIDALGSPLTEEVVFRAEIASKLLGLPLGEVISAESVAVLLTHREGITKGTPRRARIVPFVNKVDLNGGLERGRDLARKILAMRHPQIKQVVLGQARLMDPVVEVISLEAAKH